jgi:hypothetical protein
VSDLKIQNRQNTLVIVRNVKRLVRNEGESITIVLIFMDVLHKLLEEFNIIFREKWILKDLVEKQWLMFNNDLVHMLIYIIDGRTNSSIGADGTKICR